MKKNTTKESLAAKRERLVKEEAIHRQGEQEADELQRQIEEAAEAALRPTWIWVNVVTVVLISVVSMLCYASPLASWFADLMDGPMIWFFLLLFGFFTYSNMDVIAEPLGSIFATRRWQLTEALIVSTELRVMGHTDSSGPVHQPMARYEYEVDGVRYNRFFALSTWGSNTGSAELTCDEHPPGSIIKIRFNPGRPQQSMAPEFEKGTRLPILHIILQLFFVAIVGLAIAALIPAETDEVQEKIKLRNKVSVVPKPPNLWPEFRADLNKNLDDGWFFFSMGRVTRSEVNAAHKRLMNLDDKWFNSYLLTIASFSIHSDPRRAYIDNYLEALSQHSPDKLTELARRIATSLKTKQTSTILVSRMNSASFQHLIKAIETLPVEAADGVTRAEAVTRLGGFEALGARIALDYFVAVARGDEKKASAAVVGAATLDGLDPGMMPDYVGRLAAFNTGRTTTLIRRLEPESVKHLLRTDRSRHAPEFENMLVREFGLGASEAYQVSRAAKVQCCHLSTQR